MIAYLSCVQSRYLLRCLRSLWEYLTGRAASRTCSDSRSSIGSLRMQRASTPRYMNTRLYSTNADSLRFKLNLSLLHSAFDSRFICGVTSDDWCLFGEPASKQEWHEAGMFPWRPLMRFIGQNKEVFHFRMSTSIKSTVCACVCVLVQY